MILALDVQTEDGAGIVEEVGNDAADALAGARRRTGEDMSPRPIASIEAPGSPPVEVS